jgi:hypothetical protein
VGAAADILSSLRSGAIAKGCSVTKPVTSAFVSGLVAGFVAGAILSGAAFWTAFAPTKAKLDMVVYSAVRLGWLCHDNDIDFDRCALVASGNAGDRP